MFLKDIPSKGGIEIIKLAASSKPAAAFESFIESDHAFFLDTVLPDCNALGHYSFIGEKPFLTITGRGDQISIHSKSGATSLCANPFDVLGETVRHFRIYGERGDIPFTGGAVGYLAYDLGRFLERLPHKAVDDSGFPELYLAWYDRVLAHDHRDGSWYFCRTIFDGETPDDLEKEARAFSERIDSGYVADLGETFRGHADSPESNFTKEQYIAAVNRALEYIGAGDIYQVNLSQRFKAARIEHPYATYRRLRKLNSAPMASYLGFNGVSVLCSSPERYMKVTGRHVETRPIKGTRPRGRDADEDARNKRRLLSSEKDRAELTMIVDLERNDLGRVCEYGSVRVTRHAALETYATVHHLVSTVEGRLREGLDVVDLIRASFPGGSITGAPKIRSMEIIDELEPTSRNVYTGAIGYIGFNRDADLNIAIRTIIAGPESLSFQVGGGIVADSTPEDEYIETLVKGQAIFDTLKNRRRGER